MKKMKMKLMASLAMLVVATLMLSSTSYAWYTINTQAKISQLSITLANTRNVEVAKAYYNDGGTTFTMVNEVTNGSTEGQANGDNSTQKTFGGSLSYTGVSTKIELPSAKITSIADVSGTNVGTYNTDKTAYPYTGSVLTKGMAGVVYDETGRTSGFRMATAKTDSNGLTYYEYEYDAIKELKATIAMSYTIFLRTNVSGEISVAYTQNSETTAAQTGWTVTDYGVLDVTAAAMADLVAEYDAVGDSGKVTKLKGDYVDLPTGIEVGKTRAEVTALLKADGYYGHTSGQTNVNVAVDEANFYNKEVSISGTDSKAFTAKANHVYLIEIFVYIDGEQVKAKDFTNDGDKSGYDVSLKDLTFTNNNISDKTQVWEDDPAASISNLTAKLTGGTYTIEGFNTGAQHDFEYSTDSGATWTGLTTAQVPGGIFTCPAGDAAGKTYLFRVKGYENYPNKSVTLPSE